MRFVGILIDGITSPFGKNEHQFWDYSCILFGYLDFLSKFLSILLGGLDILPGCLDIQNGCLDVLPTCFNNVFPRNFRVLRRIGSSTTGVDTFGSTQKQLNVMPRLFALGPLNRLGVVSMGYILTYILRRIYSAKAIFEVKLL